MNKNISLHFRGLLAHSSAIHTIIIAILLTIGMNAGMMESTFFFKTRLSILVLLLVLLC